jgi:hypothetical protein
MVHRNLVARFEAHPGHERAIGHARDHGPIGVGAVAMQDEHQRARPPAVSSPAITSRSSGTPAHRRYV